MNVTELLGTKEYFLSNFPTAFLSQNHYLSWKIFSGSLSFVSIFGSALYAGSEQHRLSVLGDSCSTRKHKIENYNEIFDKLTVGTSYMICLPLSSLLL
jgi:hypothetical protein